MTVQEAYDVVLAEGLAGEASPEDAMFIMVRMGDEPSTERMSRLLTAIKVLFDDQRGQTVLDRRLAAALWTLGDIVMSNWESWQRNGRKWSEGFQYQVVDLHTAVESFFYDIWAVEREA